MSGVVESVETEEGQAFLEQNSLFAKAGLSAPHLEAVDQFAEHHCGGLFVLGRPEDGLIVKCHESWGPGRPDEPGDIVVHIYDPHGDTEAVRYYDDPADAIADFLLAD